MQGGSAVAPLASLLPDGVNRDRAVDGALAQEIVDFQIGQFFGRPATADELESAARHGEQCALDLCNAEEFARPSCFALLSSSEMLFY